MSHPRPFVLHEATFRQALELQPNVALLPWGATEAHNFHLPHGTDTLEATCLAERAAEQAHQLGGRCLVLPTMPFGNNNTQLTQVATITMRSATQQAVLFDVADSLVKQNIHRLVLLNFHGGNEFKPMIRDVMLDLPIFIVQVHGYQLAQDLLKGVLDDPRNGHADEFETSLMLHIMPNWVAPLSQAGSGATTASQLPILTSTPGVWCPRDWQSLSPDTGDGDPSAATAAKGAQLFSVMSERLAAMLVELSKAEEGMFPLIIRRWTV
jgi:creatinine amidohydrolase